MRKKSGASKDRRRPLVFIGITLAVFLLAGAVLSSAYRLHAQSFTGPGLPEFLSSGELVYVQAGRTATSRTEMLYYFKDEPAKVDARARKLLKGWRRTSLPEPLPFLPIAPTNLIWSYVVPTSKDPLPWEIPAETYPLAIQLMIYPGRPLSRDEMSANLDGKPTPEQAKGTTVGIVLPSRELNQIETLLPMFAPKSSSSTGTKLYPQIPR